MLTEIHGCSLIKDRMLASLNESVAEIIVSSNKSTLWTRQKGHRANCGIPQTISTFSYGSCTRDYGPQTAASQQPSLRSLWNLKHKEGSVNHSRPTISTFSRRTCPRNRAHLTMAVPPRPFCSHSRVPHQEIKKSQCQLTTAAPKESLQSITGSTLWNGAWAKNCGRPPSHLHSQHTNSIQLEKNLAKNISSL